MFQDKNLGVLTAQYERVYVRWSDAYIFNHEAWRDRQETITEFRERPVQYNETLGFLLAETDIALLVSGTIADNTLIDYALVIPRVNIEILEKLDHGSTEQPEGVSQSEAIHG